MAYANKMGTLLDKIERHLGMSMINLPDKLGKEEWAKVIQEETLDIFSKYIPNKIDYIVDPVRDKSPKGDYYIIDESIIPGNVEILGIRDYKWDAPMNSTNSVYGQGVALYDFYSTAYSIEDVGLVQGYSDLISLFNLGLYVDFDPPNKFYIKNSLGVDAFGMVKRPFMIEIFIKHAPNLMTISPTQFRIFEKLAEANVANFLYQNLKYYDGTPTVFGDNIDLKLGDLEQAAQRAEEIEAKLADEYVSSGNKNQPIIYTVD